MTLSERIAEKVDAIAEAWLARIIASMPPRTRQFVSERRDPFANPVGATLRRETRRICAALARGAGSEGSAGEALREIIQIRALQGTPASEAVSFVLELKEVLRVEVPECPHEVDRCIDMLLLSAFDRYAECRERLFDVRVNELQKSVYSLRRRFFAPDLPRGN